jgi:hypothetical protein
MKLDRPTHIRKSNRSSGWMSEFTEEIPGQIAAGIKRLGDGEYTSYSIYPLPADAAYDETVYPDEWIQTTGVAPERLTVETRRLDSDGVYRVYTIGHATDAGESEETEPILSGDNTYLVRPAEVLTSTEVIDLFQQYYDHHAFPESWQLREQAEFATPAETGAASTGQRTAGVSDGINPSASSVAASAATVQHQANAKKPEPGRQQSGEN